MTETAITAQAARNELYEIIQRDIPFEQKARDALELGTQYLGADNGHLTRIDRETDYWEAIVSTDPPDGRFPPGLELDLNTTYCRRTIEANSTIALSDAPTQGWADDPAFEAHGLHCYHGTSLIVDNNTYGTVCFVAEDPREEFSDGETMFAELIAKLLERELERQQHEAELTRQTNLAIVLNRVLRHNLRNDLSVVRGFTEMMADELGENPYSKTVLDNIDDLIRLGEKARQLDRIVAADFERESTTITALVDDIVEQVSRKYPNASVSAEYDEAIIAAVFPSLERALEELIENAAKHGGDAPTVTVSVDAVPNAVEIEITDTGPGLASHEADVLQTGTETPLTHGSGLGLWLSHWIVTSHDGTIDATVTDDGTTMTLSIPRKTDTDIHQQISELRRARDQYEAAFDEANDAMVIVNDEARILHANPEASTIYGLDQQALLGQTLQRFLPGAFDFDAAWDTFQDAGRERDSVSIVDADGIERQVEYSATTDIVPGQHLFVIRDVTERLQQKAELTTKTQAMDNAPVGITLADPNQNDNPLVYANERFCELTGYDEGEVCGQNCRFLQGDETDPETVATIRQAIDAQEPVTEVIRNYRKDGTTFWNELTIAPIRDESGDLVNWVGFQQNVTERIEREQALEETTQRLNAIIEASPDAIIALDADGTVQLWNEAAEDVFGYEEEAVIGEPIQSLGIHSDDQQSEIEQQFKLALAGETFRNHKIHRQTKDNERVQLSLSTAPIMAESGAITGVMGVATPLTEDVYG
ncbi:PAS domain S-box protein [Natrialbaceae archaeon AArc-T1-2]|uniref:PAS domain S-box protein n=1 Tax=Natrialbaceae archaeon AArc-T1-2 TaxID=3053904 RepID=UPI00255AC85A|nr:PAS domain S-box protein [Natrialbaceae archaeon AArc-T1-2]WIV67384.1 PAS domain S-box protein [Natrialbaceae archaeon AArc-T1-2]